MDPSELKAAKTETISVQEMASQLVRAAPLRKFPTVIFASEAQYRRWTDDMRAWTLIAGVPLVAPTHIMGVPIEQREGPIVLGWELGKEG